MKIESVSYRGDGNRNNEDYILHSAISDHCVVIILADGMGGLSYGDFAAKIVAHTMMETIINHPQNETPENVLHSAFVAADLAIENRCRDLKCKMGASVAIAMIVNNELYYGWQGNVRIYKYSERLMQLTRDHVSTMSGHTCLTRCINGKGFRDAISICKTDLNHGDTLYICSDGYYRDISEEQMVKTSTDAPSVVYADDASLVEIRL